MIRKDPAFTAHVLTDPHGGILQAIGTTWQKSIGNDLAVWKLHRAVTKLETFLAKSFIFMGQRTLIYCFETRRPSQPHRDRLCYSKRHQWHHRWRTPDSVCCRCASPDGDGSENTCREISLLNRPLLLRTSPVQCHTLLCVPKTEKRPTRNAAALFRSSAHLISSLLYVCASA
jgi:hypothetical protein